MTMVKTHRFSLPLPLLVPNPYATVQLGPLNGGAAGLTIEKTGSSVLKLKGKASGEGSLTIKVNKEAVTLQIEKGASALEIAQALKNALPKYTVASSQTDKQATILKFSLPL